MAKQQTKSRITDDAPEESMTPTEFSVIYIIQRQLPIYWQKFFESALQLQKPAQGRIEDCYQYHAFVLKTNRFFMSQKRFVVLSLMWMMNVDAGFSDKTCKQCTYKDLKWRVPLEALVRVQLNQEKEYIVMSVYFNEAKQNEILVAAGYKMVKKDKEKRKLKFMDVAAARDFLFHLKRLHHLWNRSQGRHDDVPAI